SSPAAEGEQLFSALACNTCHAVDAPGARGPQLGGLFGTPVRLRTGQSVVADENYLRESILNPATKIVAGYEPIMPTFEGQVDEQQLIYLITYIKSLGAKEQAGGAAGAQGAPAQTGPSTKAAPPPAAPATTTAQNP
ncbi:MAG TPA: cytochrome c, partial [Thermoanaerobaculia bacterium]